MLFLKLLYFPFFLISMDHNNKLISQDSNIARVKRAKDEGCSPHQLLQDFVERPLEKKSRYAPYWDFVKKNSKNEVVLNDITKLIDDLNYQIEDDASFQEFSHTGWLKDIQTRSDMVEDFKEILKNEAHRKQLP